MARKYDSFRGAPPGWTMTQPRGQWNWDSPPKFTRPDEAIDYLIERIEQPETEMTYIKMMLAGVSVEEIVRSITMVGFAQGFYTPDVAEIIKPPLSIYFMGVAAEKGIPVRVFAGTDDGSPQIDEGMTDEDLMTIMQKRNPQVYSMYVERELQSGKRRKRMQGTFMEPGLQPMVEEEMAVDRTEAVEERIQESPLEPDPEFAELEREIIEEETGTPVGREELEEGEVVVEFVGQQGELPL